MSTKKAAKKKPGKHYHSSITGQLVSKKTAEANPDTTYGTPAKKKK
jgi:hypothetical protein